MDGNKQNRSGQVVSDVELKESLIGIMDSVDRFCRENNIKYFLIAGTMLGAVRHKGFIPWDDDIDIGMLREDYEKFCRQYNDEQKVYQVKCIHNDPQYYLPFAKVIDTRISLHEEVYKAPEIGAYIDVFPLDYVERDTAMIYYRGSFVQTLEDLRYMQTRKDRAFWKNALILISRVLCPRSMHSIAKTRETRALKIASSMPTDWIANLYGAWGIREIAPAACYGDGEDYTFEGRSYRGVADYDTYLSGLYGDYMTPPPPEKRVTHHSFTACWK